MNQGPSIRYSSEFDEFLDSLDPPGEDARKKMVNQAIKEYVSDPERLPIPQDCDRYENRKKAAIPEANVVVYYDEEGPVWTFISGMEIHKRVA